MNDLSSTGFQALGIAASHPSKQKNHLLFDLDLRSPSSTEGSGEHSLDPLEDPDPSTFPPDTRDGYSNDSFNWVNNYNPVESLDPAVSSYINTYQWATPLIPSLSIEDYDPISPSVLVLPPDLSPTNYLYPIVSPGTIITSLEGEYGPIHFSDGSDCSVIDSQYSQDSEGSFSVNKCQFDDIRPDLLCAFDERLSNLRITLHDPVTAKNSSNTGQPLHVDLPPTHENGIIDSPPVKEKRTRKSSKKSASPSTRQLVAQIRAMNLDDSPTTSSSTRQSRGEIPALDTVPSTRVTPTNNKLFFRSVGTKNIRLASEARRSEASTAKFKCKICPHTFTTKHNVEYHERAHSGEKPFKCDNCPAAFGSLSDCKRHMNKGTSCRRPRHSPK